MSDTDALATFLSGERGSRTVENMDLGLYFQFGDLIRRYQRDHPDTLVRTKQFINPHRQRGTITVRWWPRGEEEPAASA